MRSTTGEVSSDAKGAVVGAMISGGFGLAWSLWGASGLSGPPSTVVRIAGICGNLLLGAIGHGEYIIAWVATVVGVHFLAFGRQFWIGFYGVGAALIAAGMAGTIVGLLGGSAGAIKATAGLISAASLFVASGWTIAKARDRAHA